MCIRDSRKTVSAEDPDIQSSRNRVRAVRSDDRIHRARAPTCGRRGASQRVRHGSDTHKSPPGERRRARECWTNPIARVGFTALLVRFYPLADNAGQLWNSVRPASATLDRDETTRIVCSSRLPPEFSSSLTEWEASAAGNLLRRLQCVL